MPSGKVKLKRELNLLDVFCIATGAMISSGLFILPGLAHAQAGPAVILSYMIAGLLAMTGMLSQAELVSAMPKSGGTYFYVTRSMGPALGTIDGLLTWLSVSLKSSFALVGMAAFTYTAVHVDARLLGLMFCLIFLVLNYVGIKEAGRLQVVLVVLLLALVLLFVFSGMKAIDPRNIVPFMPHGPASVFSVAGFVFVSYGGLLKVASIAEEVKAPERTIPLGMILSFISVWILYGLVVLVTTGVLSSAELDNSMTPISDAAFKFMGPWGALALSGAAVLAFISTANAGMMAASRYPLALSRDRLIPDVFSRVGRRFKTPGPAIVVTSLLMIAALFLDLTILVKVASIVLISTFMFSCLCVIVMRESGVQNYQPKFRAPLYPWLQIIGIFGCWMLAVSIGKEALIIASLLFAAGLLVYWFYGRDRGKKDFALLHLVERVAAREFIDTSLETELKNIIQERDDITKDRFDRIVEESVVLDIEGAINVIEFFDTVAKKISVRLGTKPSVIFRSLLDREEQSSTVLSPGLAIPHIIVEGEHTFVLLLARCKEGIVFPGKDGKVRMVFVIAGTQDERNFHLRALSSIAQIIQSPGFEKKWLRARSKEALRDLVLLGKRNRQV